VKPAEASVDREKQRALGLIAREYLRRLPGETLSRFDVITVYYEGKPRRPQFELLQDAFSVS
jgi:Holliday junction resolvase-like predicted endonuclease